MDGGSSTGLVRDSDLVSFGDDISIKRPETIRIMLHNFGGLPVSQDDPKNEEFRTMLAKGDIDVCGVWVCVCVCARLRACVCVCT